MYSFALLVASDVCYSAKIRILKQITTHKSVACGVFRCLLLCKDKNFKANHNIMSKIYFPKSDVCYSAKIRILKQITTHDSSTDNSGEMFVTLQR